MTDKKRNIRPFIAMILLCAYVVLAFGWWTLLHLENIEERKDLIEHSVDVTYYLESEGGAQGGISYDDRFSESSLKEAMERLKSQRIMIISEGIVFFLVLVIGIWRIYVGFTREFELSRQQRNFMLSITHELKSPLAGIKLAVQSLMRPQMKPEMRERFLNNSLKDVERLQTLVENILMAAKIDGQVFNEVMNEINISQLVDEHTYKMEGGIGQKMHYHIDIQPGLVIRGEETALTSIIVNLLENAIKYSPDGSEISVKVKAEGKRVAFSVADQGYGIPDAEKKKVFDKFYRVGNEDTRRSKGTGLGLFLVKQLVELHKGSIAIKNNHPQGTIFEVTFPLEKTLAVVEDDYFSQPTTLN